MTRSSLGSKAVGLCALAVVLTAFTGSAAQAETGATWRVKGANIPGATDLLPQLVISEIENKTVVLAVTIFAKPFLLLCTHAAIDEGGKLIANGGISLGRVLFTSCLALFGGEITACHPHSPGLMGGILSERATGLIVLDKLANGEVTELVKLTPENAKGEPSKLLAIVELGEFCAIGEQMRIETTKLGEGLWLTDGEGKIGSLTERIAHLVVEGLTQLLADGQPAKIVGSALLELGGEHQGLQWSGVPS
jgi:hypothetical protein